MTDQPIENKKKYSWDETVRTFLIAVVLAVVFRSLAYEPFHIPSGSMKSNLLVGDYLFVSKYTYGYSRYSFPFGPPVFKGRILENLPQRGDVVVFRLPPKPRIDYIKRIMGLPGDHIQVKGGIVYINGEPLPREYADTYTDIDENTGAPLYLPRFHEKLPEGKSISILKERKGSTADDTPIFTVPPKHYFMMGDNRDHSLDSRFMYTVGFVPEENLVGRAEIIFFSTDGSADWLNPASWLSAMRFSRFFTHIE